MAAATVVVVVVVAVVVVVVVVPADLSFPKKCPQSTFCPLAKKQRYLNLSFQKSVLAEWSKYKKVLCSQEISSWHVGPSFGLVFWCWKCVVRISRAEDQHDCL